MGEVNSRNQEFAEETALLTEVTKNLLADSGISFFEYDWTIIAGHVAIGSVCKFDLEELKRNVLPQQYVHLVKERLILAFDEIKEFAEGRIIELKSA